MKNIKKLCTTYTLLGACLFSALATDVMAQRRGTGAGINAPRPGHGQAATGRFGRAHRNRGQQFIVKSEFIGKVFYPGQRLFMRNELGLNQRGLEVEKVELEIDGYRNGGVATLLINGKKVSRPQQFRGARMPEQVITFNLARPFKIGQNLNSLQVQFNGTAYVSEVLVILKKQAPPAQRNSVEKRVHVSFYGDKTVDLSSAMSVAARASARPVRNVQLTLRNHSRAAQIRLCSGPVARPNRGGARFDVDLGPVNIGVRLPGVARRPARGAHSANCQATQLIRGFGQQTISLPANGVKLADLKLMGRGQFDISKVKVNFAR